MALTTFGRFDEPFFSFADVDRVFDDDFFDSAFGWGPRNRRGAGRDSSQAGAVERRGVGNGAASFWPKMDLHEDEGQNIVTATVELPGLRKEDVNIDFRDNQIVVSGATSSDSEKEENGYVVRERRAGRFSRALPVSPGVKFEDVKAAMDNGVLTITYPRISEEQRAKRIEIS